MRTWESDCGAAGISLAAESVMANEAPDDSALGDCRTLGSMIAG